jgi:hypothetical protein
MRLSLRALCATLLVVTFVVGSADLASARGHVVKLTHAQRRAIVRAPHPYLRSTCGPVLALSARRTTIGSRRVLVAQTQCKYGTAGSPLELAVYARRDGHLRQLYRLNSGRAVHRGRFFITSGAKYTAHGRRVVLHYDGYGPKDAMCCPSRSYHRVFHLGPATFTHGRLVRDP